MNEIKWSGEQVPGILSDMVKQLVAEKFPNSTLSGMRFGVRQGAADVLDEGDSQYVECAFEILPIMGALASARFHWNAGKALQNWDGKEDLLPRFADLEVDRVVLYEVDAFVPESEYQLKVDSVNKLIDEDLKRTLVREMRHRGIEMPTEAEVREWQKQRKERETDLQQSGGS